MATHDYLKTENEQLKLQLARREHQLVEAKQVHDQYCIERQEKEDLLFALLHSFGPHINIRIENFREYLKDSNYGGTLAIQDDGTFEAHLVFCQEGFEQHFRRKLFMDGNEQVHIKRCAAYEGYLKEEATPEEAYTLAITTYPS